MIRIHAFAAERPPAEMAAAVASVPYDVVSTAEAREKARGNEASFLHVVRPEIDLPNDTDPYSDAVYDRARANLEQFRNEGLLHADDHPGIYLYRLTWQLVPRVSHPPCASCLRQPRHELVGSG